MGRVDGKVAFISGAARGQGRSHALRLAEEGADIIAVDLCEDVATNPYPLAREEDLAETALLVEKFGRRIIARKADVRERAQLQAVIDEGIAEFGHLDVVVAQAGIAPLAPDSSPVAFMDAVDIKLAGVTNTVSVAMPHLKAGASIICTGSAGAYSGSGATNPAIAEGGGAGGLGYTYAVQAVAQFVHDLALAVGPLNIRVNGIHPGNTNTSMLHGLYPIMRPDLENPTKEDAEVSFRAIHLMPVTYVEPLDISNTVLFLASDESRLVTGMQMHTDAGVFVKNNAFKI